MKSLGKRRSGEAASDGGLQSSKYSDANWQTRPDFKNRRQAQKESEDWWSAQKSEDQKPGETASGGSSPVKNKHAVDPNLPGEPSSGNRGRSPSGRGGRGRG
jgi:hypothetical protein